MIPVKAQINIRLRAIRRYLPTLVVIHTATSLLTVHFQLR